VVVDGGWGGGGSMARARLLSFVDTWRARALLQVVEPAKTGEGLGIL
jgi:hypothetical protein